MLIQSIQHLLNLNQQKSFIDTVKTANQLLSQFPHQPQVFMLQALALAELNETLAAKYAIDQAFQYGEKSAYAYYVRGRVAELMDDWPLAVESYSSANQLDSNAEYQLRYLVLKQNLANHADDLIEILTEYDTFIRQYPQMAILYQNRSVILKKLGLYQLALEDIEKCISLDPQYFLAKVNRGMVHNLLGNFAEGWRDYEYRIMANPAEYQLPKLKAWQGEDLYPHEKLLIVVEQGFGDNIQFVRYAFLAKQNGLNVVVMNHVGLEGLLDFNLHQAGIETLPNGSPIPSTITHYVSMMSLPYYLGTRSLADIPLSSAYLVPPPEAIAKWQTAVHSNALKIGLVWTGSQKHHDNIARSLNLTAFLPLFGLEAEFHCLQKVVSEADCQQSQHIDNLTLWDQSLQDFSDTAALIAQLDLVISVDTSVAHLAAALGKPTWILLGYNPDFRWLLHRSDSPWYQSVSLFRQEADYDWDQVIARIYSALQENLQK